MNLYRETLDKSRTLTKKRESLQQELDLSLSLMELWPEAFSHGSAFGRMSGSIHSPAEFWFIIKNGVGAERSFPFWKIPIALIDYHLAKLYEKIKANHALTGSDVTGRIERMRGQLDNSGRL
jgi:hypothetical protein